MMTRLELNYILKVLNRIKEPDEHVYKAKAFIKKDIANYNARRGQLKEVYETDYDW
jgi:hypothetical protein